MYCDWERLEVRLSPHIVDFFKKKKSNKPSTTLELNQNIQTYTKTKDFRCRQWRQECKKGGSKIQEYDLKLCLY